jgi:hypothetical protein
MYPQSASPKRVSDRPLLNGAALKKRRIRPYSGLPLAQESCHTNCDTSPTTLEVDFVRLAECLVGPGWRLSLDASDTAAIHYNLAGTGRMITDKWPPISVSPHTLAIFPPGTAF